MSLALLRGHFASFCFEPAGYVVTSIVLSNSTLGHACERTRRFTIMVLSKYRMSKSLTLMPGQFRRIRKAHNLDDYCVAGGMELNSELHWASNRGGSPARNRRHGAPITVTDWASCHDAQSCASPFLACLASWERLHLEKYVKLSALPLSVYALGQTPVEHPQMSKAGILMCIIASCH